jgi:delta 1-pyrroline-5-carboxylate dehydrogenase
MRRHTTEQHAPEPQAGGFCIPAELRDLVNNAEKRQIERVRQQLRDTRRQQPDWETTREELRRRRQAEKRLPPC